MTERREPLLPTDRVAAEIRARILADEWAADERLPSVPELAEQHHSSRATVTKVLHRLADERLLVIIANWGTFRAPAEPPAE